MSIPLDHAADAASLFDGEKSVPIRIDLAGTLISLLVAPTFYLAVQASLNASLVK